MDSDKAKTIALLAAWIGQRPGLDRNNYERGGGYQSEARRIARDGREARTLLKAIEWRGISGADLRDASERAFSGRLELKPDRIDYCTGQYWPTEYRAAACAVLARALWYYWRDHVPESVENKGQYLRDKARKEFGRGIQSRWFN